MNADGLGTGDGLDGSSEHTVPVWAVFGDLMAGMLGAFVLILLYVLAGQLQLSARLDQAVEQHRQDDLRRSTLERLLAGPLASGRVTLDHGRIGISGSVLFAFNSADLQPDGRQVLKSLAGPLAAYLKSRDEWLMVSGYTDDRQVRGGTQRFVDNWELSAQRALTVTRALIDEGVPPSAVFAAAFGAQQPVASNDDAAGRSRNRRVEMAPMTKASEGYTPKPSEAPTAKPADLPQPKPSDADRPHG